MNCTGMKCKNCALNSCTVQMLKPLIESVVNFCTHYSNSLSDLLRENGKIPYFVCQLFNGG
jgi:hypothetical protein